MPTFERLLFELNAAEDCTGEATTFVWESLTRCELIRHGAGFIFLVERVMIYDADHAILGDWMQHSLQDP